MIVIWLDSDEYRSHDIQDHIRNKYRSFIERFSMRINNEEGRGDFFYHESLTSYTHVLILYTNDRDGQVSRYITRRLLDKMPLEEFTPVDCDVCYPPIIYLRRVLREKEDANDSKERQAKKTSVSETSTP